MGLDNRLQGADAMAKCPHHDDLQADVREVRADVREVNRKLDALAIHLIPQATRNGNGTHVSVQATGQQAAQPGPSTEAYWLKIVALCLVILTAGSVIWSRVAALVGPLMH